MALSSDWSSSRSKFMSSLLNIQPSESLQMGKILVSKSEEERGWEGEKKKNQQTFLNLRNMFGSLALLSARLEIWTFSCLEAELSCVQTCWHYREQSGVAVNMTSGPHEDWQGWLENRPPHTCTLTRTHTHTQAHISLWEILSGMYSRPVAVSKLSDDLRSLLASRCRTPNQSFSLAARLWSSESVHPAHADTHTHMHRNNERGSCQAAAVTAV